MACVKKRGESFVSVIVGVAILSGVLLTIGTLLSANNTLQEQYEKNITAFLLRNNITNILKKLDTSQLTEGDVAVLSKNDTTHTLTLLTGSTNFSKRYINAQLDTITNTGSYDSALFMHLISMDKSSASGSASTSQIMKVSIREMVRK